MGMTDRQFDTFIKGLMRELKRIDAAITEEGVDNSDLKEIIKDLEDQLKRP